MGVRAVLRSGGVEVELHDRYGKTPEDVVRDVTSRSLTGSANPFADLWLETKHGGDHVRYDDVVQLRPDGAR